MASEERTEIEEVGTLRCMVYALLVLMMVAFG